MTERGPGIHPVIGWNVDPTGRYRLRWFDGEGWSAQISDGQVMGTDRELLPAGLKRPGLSSLLLWAAPALVLIIMVSLAIKGV